MGLKRDKFRGIVGGITSQPEEEAPAPTTTMPMVKQGVPEPDNASAVPASTETEHHRFAKRGRPKGGRIDLPSSKGRKVKVSLFLSETIVNDLYDWAYADKIHPGEMFERALKPFHEKEAKRRNPGKE